MSAKKALDLCRWLQELGLRPMVLLVAHGLAHRVDRDFECWPSLATIAGDVGVSKSTVAVALRELEEKGVVIRERRRDGRRGNLSTKYRFRIGPEQAELWPGGGTGAGQPLSGLRTSDLRSERIIERNSHKASGEERSPDAIMKAAVEANVWRPRMSVGEAERALRAADSGGP